jgi:hypothetical protein
MMHAKTYLDAFFRTYWSRVYKHALLVTSLRNEQIGTPRYLFVDFYPHQDAVVYASYIHPVKPLFTAKLLRAFATRLRVGRLQAGLGLASGNDTKLGTNQEGVSLDTGTVTQQEGGVYSSSD